MPVDWSTHTVGVFRYTGLSLIERLLMTHSSPRIGCTLTGLLVPCQQEKGKKRRKKKKPSRKEEVDDSSYCRIQFEDNVTGILRTERESMEEGK